MKFKIAGALDESAIRHILREAETGIADGVDPKEPIIAACLDHLASIHAAEVKQIIGAAFDLADMLGQGENDILGNLRGSLAELIGQIGVPTFENIVTSAADLRANLDARSYALAKAAAETTKPDPKSRGRWLSKLGIVKDHIQAITPSAAAPAADPPPPPEAPEMDPELAAMLGMAPAQVPPPPPLADMSAASVGAPPLTTPAAAPSAAPGGADGYSPRDGFVLMGGAMDTISEDIIKRLGVSKATLYNWTSGKTQRVKITPEQARIVAAECDRRAADLRTAASIFASITA